MYLASKYKFLIDGVDKHFGKRKPASQFGTRWNNNIKEVLVIYVWGSSR